MPAGTKSVTACAQLVRAAMGVCVLYVWGCDTAPSLCLRGANWRYPPGTSLAVGWTLKVEVARQDLLYDCHGPALRDGRWEVLDPRIAGVDASGSVHGRMVGQTSLRVRFAGSEARAAITVVPRVKRIEVRPADTTLTVGDTVRFAAIAYGADDEPLPTVRLALLVTNDSTSRRRDLADPLWQASPPGVRHELNSVLVRGWRNGDGHVVAYLAGRQDSVRVRVRRGPITQ